MVDAVILSDSRAERGAREDVGSKGNSGTSGNESNGRCEPQTGTVAAVDSRYNI